MRKNPDIWQKWNVNTAYNLHRLVPHPDCTLSHCIRKPTTCISEIKGADQLCSNCTADQHLCFHCIDGTPASS